MKTVLFITYFYPPMAGSVRALKFSQLLPEYGWKPIIISGIEKQEWNGQDSHLFDMNRDNQVHYVSFKVPNMELRYGINKLKLNCEFDYYWNWYHPAMKEAEKIIRNNQIDLIYVSCSPNTSSVIACDLKKKFHIPIVIEWRDMWSGSEFKNKYMCDTLIQPLRSIVKSQIRDAEKRSVLCADRTITTSWRHAEYLRKQYGVDSDRITVITNGYDEDDYKSVVSMKLYPDKMTLVWSGNIYLGYIEVGKKFLEVIEKMNKDIQLIYIGRGADQLSNVSHRNLTVLQYMPKSRALPIIKGADLGFIVILPQSDWVMPTETYEFMRLAKPTIVFAPEKSDCFETLQSAIHTVRLPYDRAGMADKMEELYDCWQRKMLPTRCDLKYIQQFERRNLVSQLARTFNEVIIRGV